MGYTMYANENLAIGEAARLAKVNQCPVGVIFRDGWYRVEEDCEAYEDAIDVDGWQPVTVCDPAYALTVGELYTVESRGEFGGWSDGADATVGYHLDSYFDSEGRYLGPDARGIEPLFF